ncbi:MAG: MbnP family protein [Bacteroidia bacterium]
MKTLKIALIVLSSLLFVTLTGCKSEGCTDPFAVNYEMDAKEGGECTYPDVTMMISQKVGDADLVIGDTYSINGYDVQFTQSQFYVSSVMYMDEEGNGYAAEKDGEPVYLLVKPDQKMYNLGTARAGHTHMVRFDVGVDAATNSQTDIDFAQWAGDHPLAAQTPSMAWSWAAGYIFIRIEGKIDIDKDGDFDGDDKDLIYHIGKNDNQVSISLMSHTDFDEASETLGVEFDLANLFNNLDLTNEDNHVSHTGSSQEQKNLVTTIKDNVAGAFSIHKHE